MDNLRIALNEVVELFPDEVKSGVLRRNYSAYILMLRTILPYLNGNKKATILDIGAGAGVIPLVLGKMGYCTYAIDTWEEYGTDYDNISGKKEDIINRLETNGVQTKYCNIEKELIPFGECSLDMVLFIDVLEHLRNSPKKVLKEIRRVLKPDGILLITTPNLSTLKNRLYLLLGRSVYTALDYWYHTEPFFGHIREYTVDEVKKMLGWEKFGIKSVKLSNCYQASAIKNFRPNPYSLMMGLYLFITTLIPKYRYLMIVTSIKNEE